jgi:hypothetical protein
LQASIATPAAVDDLQNLPADYAAISAADVRKAAAEWLSKRPITIIVTARAGAGAGAAP